MIIDCIAFSMGFFVGTTGDGRVIFGKRDPITKQVIEPLYEYECLPPQETYKIKVRIAKITSGTP